jgi:uncharacterized protein (DUF1697 family)
MDGALKRVVGHGDTPAASPARYGRESVRAKRYVALLRGINVGGRNLIAMADLREAFEAHGHKAVSTYIQSGNVLFESSTPRDSLEGDLEAMLERRFGVPLVVVLRTHRQLHNVVENAPDGFGGEPDIYHSDVVFLKAPLTSQRAMRVVELREGVDQAWPGTGVIYFARLSARRAQSRMGRIVGTPEYQQMTIRSWTTTTKLLGLLDARAAG